MMPAGQNADINQIPFVGIAWHLTTHHHFHRTPIALGDSCDYTFKHWIMQTNYSIHYSIQNKRFFIHFGKRYSKWPKLKLGLALLSHFSTLYALLHIFVWQFYNFFLRMTHFFHLINNWFNFTKKIIHSTKYSFKEQMRYWPGLPTTTPVQDLMAGQKPPAPAFVKLLFELFSFSNFHPVNMRWHFTCAVHINQRLKEEGGFILQWLHKWHIYTLHK